MRIEGSDLFAESRERVFAVFTDGEALARATPGVQQMVRTGENQYDAVMKIGVAGITGTYQGTLMLAELRPPERYELQISGQGASGVIQGTGVFDFEEDGAGTKLRYVWDVKVEGLIAGVGQRVLGGVAKMLLGQFSKAMAKEIKG